MGAVSIDPSNIETEHSTERAHDPRLVPCPRRSPWLIRLFSNYSRRYIGRHFHALRVSREGTVPVLPEQPLIIAANHASWWDPLIGLVLSREMPECRAHYVPIDVKGLEQYRFLERLGFFGIEVGTTRGSLAFLRQSLAVLSRPESVLWITAQGEFTDIRERPTRLKEGIGHLIHRLDSVTVVTLAIEYTFWNDRLPEVLVRFGSAIEVSSGREASPAAWTARIGQALEETQDRLAEEARRRDPADFTTVVGGRAGVGGVYDLWRHSRARLRGESFDPEHQLGNRSPTAKRTP
jgi:1-acyl-sn-glycerol-3-phosphate acyltransferase